MKYRLRRIRNKVSHFFYVHDTLYYSLCVILGLSLVLGSIVLLIVVFSQPECARVADAFTGEFQYSVVTGCFVQLSDGKFYSLKTITVIPQTLEIKLKDK